MFWVFRYTRSGKLRKWVSIAHEAPTRSPWLKSGLVPANCIARCVPASTRRQPTMPQPAQREPLRNRTCSPPAPSARPRRISSPTERAKWRSAMHAAQWVFYSRHQRLSAFRWCARREDRHRTRAVSPSAYRRTKSETASRIRAKIEVTFDTEKAMGTARERTLRGGATTCAKFSPLSPRSHRSTINRCFHLLRYPPFFWNSGSGGSRCSRA